MAMPIQVRDMQSKKKKKTAKTPKARLRAKLLEQIRFGVEPICTRDQ
jgi:hypothetical protein